MSGEEFSNSFSTPASRARSDHWTKNPWESVSPALSGAVAPEATTGAPTANREPVSVTEVDTTRRG